MTSAIGTGRLIGVLLLAHFAGGLILPYVLLNSAIAPDGAFLTTAAPHAAQLRTAVILFLMSAAMAVGIAATAWPVFREHTYGMALAFLALAIANVPLQAFESSVLLSMLSLSQEYTRAAGGDASMLQGAAAGVAAMRRWTHFIQLLLIVSWLFALYALLWRTALVPRVLAALGMIATALQIIGVPLRAMLGYGVVIEMAMPLAPIHVALAVWLIVKGFR